MSSVSDERLSRYLEGDLSPEESAAIEAQVATTPAVAEALEDLRALRTALRELPTELPPPTLQRPAPTSHWRRAIPWAVAAAACLLWLLRAPTVGTVVLASGVSEVTGDVRVLAGDVTIDLDGRARITVEPPGGVLRPAESTSLEEDPMNVRLPLAALAGAAVTVVVLEGSALVATDGAAPVTLEPGSPHAFGTPSAEPLPEAPAARAAVLQARLADLTAQLDATRQELAASSFSRDLAQGQLEMLQGSESPWPDDVRESLTPERFEEALREQLADVDGVDVDRLDCDEYPCVAVLRLAEDGDLEGWNEPEADGIREWILEELGEGGSMSVNTSAFR
ncbi:MAG: hypothetical protein AAF602_20445, partial [Myxococcota bacterium]